MIRKTQSYTDSKDVVHASLEEAQEHEIRYIVNENDDLPADFVAKASDRLMKAQAKVVDILTTKPNSRPGARTINGAKRIKKRSKAPAAQPELPTPTTTAA